MTKSLDKLFDITKDQAKRITQLEEYQDARIDDLVDRIRHLEDFEIKDRIRLEDAIICIRELEEQVKALSPEPTMPTSHYFPATHVMDHPATHSTGDMLGTDARPMQPGGLPHLKPYTGTGRRVREHQEAKRKAVDS